MPLLHIRTNVAPAGETRRDLLAAASRAMATMLGKPESYVMVSLDSAADLMFGGSDEPAAFLTVKSLGLPEDQTVEFTQTLSAVIGEHLAIDPARIYVEFSAPPRHMWGFDNRTFG